jgi:hypothetical protein
VSAKAAAAAAARAESRVRTARKEGREVVTMRCFAEGPAWTVECDVYPVTGLRVEPLRPGPYRFPTPELADVFLAEATRALEHLGCKIS